MTAALPPPPVSLTMPHGWQIAYTAATCAALIVLGGNAIRVWRRSGDTLPLLCLAGGAVCMVLEPLVDLLGLCWYPRAGQWKLFELMGRPIPVLVLPGYAFFMGGLTVLAVGWVRQSGPRQLFRALPLLMLVELPFELLANHTGVYVYYGHQPLRVLGFPMWWLFVNSMVPLTAGLLFVRVRPLLSEWKLVAVVALLPVVDAGVNAATAWPVWTALNSRVPAAVTQATGLCTCFLAVFGLWLITGLGGEERAARRPFSMEVESS